MNFYIIVALMAGAVLPIQALVNGRLSSGLGSALLAANISFIVASICLVLVQLGLAQALPPSARIGAIPLWAWFGGLLGVVYVVGAITSVGAIGTTAAICLIIAGQIAAALLADQFGLIGAASHPLTVTRLIGAFMVGAGAIVVLRG
ncbi:MAG TPA: DMT family transporter [Dongiaceae bacterium]|nr:DMT family transporter [Dongiaceae bacterium]